MFEIIAELSPYELQKTRENQRLQWGTLFLRLSDGAFPGEGWSDYLAVLLPIWFANARVLRYGLVEEMRQEFMDEAPRFAFVIRRISNEQIQARFLEGEREVAQALELPLAAYEAALVKAGNNLLRQIEPVLGDSDPHVEEFKRAMSFYQSR